MTLQLFSLKDRTVIITGGLGQLGRQYTKAVLESGAKVASIDLKLPDNYESYPNFRHYACDISKRDQLEKTLSQIQDQLGVPYGLINNAALDSPPNSPAAENGAFEDYPEESWDKVMQVNVKGTMLACQVFGGAMAAAGGGSIINIGSIYGVVSPDQSLYEYRRTNGETFFKPVAYSASKSAIMNLTRYLAVYWSKQKVRVNSLVLAGVFNNQDARFLEGYCKRMPLGRMANADEYNGSVIYLLSDASSYMTGSTLTVDGGWTAW